MTEKRLLWSLGGVTTLVLVAALAVCVARALEDRVTPENCDRIKVGMTEREVEAILGRPADGRQWFASWWIGEEWAIGVYFDFGSVIGKEFMGIQGEVFGFIEK